MTPQDMLKALALAAQQCSDVYYYAQHDADVWPDELVKLMSAIDTCLHEAMDLIEARK